jgi:hypothetical protein
MYRFTARFLNLSTADALRNSDSFALFAGSITEGVPLTVLPVFSAAGGVAGTPGAPATWWARLYSGAEFQHPALSVFNPTLGVGVTFIGDPTTPAPGSITGPTMMASLLGGVRIANPRPGGAGGVSLSLFGGPAVAVGIGGVGLGAEAGIGLGYRWRFIDVSVGTGYDYDPTRASGSRNIVSGYASIGVIPLF